MIKTPPPLKLPNKPSALIRMAIRDLIKCRNNPRWYTIDMYNWHKPKNGKCSVCFAGSVMACHGGSGIKEHVDPYFNNTFSNESNLKFKALNYFRCGDISVGLDQLGIKKPKEWKNYRRVEDYDDNPEMFISDMKKLASDLAKEGL